MRGTPASARACPERVRMYHARSLWRSGEMVPGSICSEHLPASTSPPVPEQGCLEATVISCVLGQTTQPLPPWLGPSGLGR